MDTTEFTQTYGNEVKAKQSENSDQNRESNINSQFDLPAAIKQGI